MRINATLKNGKRTYTMYQFNEKDVRVITLDENLMNDILIDMKIFSITDIYDGNTFMEVTFEDKITLIVDDVEFFLEQGTVDDAFVIPLGKKIINYMFQYAVDNKVKKTPVKKGAPRHIPTVKKQNPLGKRLVVGITGLATLLSIMVATHEYTRESDNKEALDLPPEKEIIVMIDKPNLDNEIAIDDRVEDKENVNPPEVEVVEDIKPEPVAVYAFEDWTETGKLEMTQAECGAYLDFYIERYGLPRNLTHALFSLEYGIFNCDDRSNGSLGPAQLYITSQNGQTYHTPVYKDGKLTGEYDDFVALMDSDINDPKWDGYQIARMEDPEQNIKIGCAYLRACIDKYRNIYMATYSYNRGMYRIPQVYKNPEQPIPNTLEHYMNNNEDLSWLNVFSDDYLLGVFKYLPTDEEGMVKISYMYEDEEITTILQNQNRLEQEISR